MMTAPKRGAKILQRGAALCLSLVLISFTSSYQQLDSKIAAKSAISKKIMLPMIGSPTLYMGRKRDRGLGSVIKTPVTVTGLRLI